MWSHAPKCSYPHRRLCGRTRRANEEAKSAAKAARASADAELPAKVAKAARVAHRSKAPKAGGKEVETEWDKLPADSVLPSVAEGSCPRFEVCIKVVNADGESKKVHVKTFTQKSYAHFQTLGQKLATEIESKGLNKRQALEFVESTLLP